jgi:long-chain fatty acid transport protein
VRLLAGALLVVALVAAPRGDGAGFALFEQGSRATALGGAFVAQADDPSAMFYNPAGNAFNEKLTFYGGAFGIIRPTAEFTGSSPYPGDGYTAKMSNPLYFIGNGYGVLPLQPGKLNLAVGFWTPAGLGTPWENSEQFAGRYINQRADIRQVALSAQISWKATDWLAIGAGPELRFSDVKLSQNQGLYNPYAGRVTDVAHLSLQSKGTPVDVTWNAGIMIKPCDRLRFGVAYHGGVDVEYSGIAHFYQLTSGHADFDAAVGQKIPMNKDLGGTATIKFPGLLLFGVSYDLSPSLTLNVDGNYTWWDVLEQIPLNIEGVPPKIIPEHWKNTWTIRAGLGWQASKTVWLGGGYVYDQTPQPDAAVSPLLPDANRVGGSIGAGFQLSKMFRIEVSTLFLWFKERTTTTNESNFNGTYKVFAILPGINIKSTF